MLSFYVYILQNNGFTCIGLLIYGYAKTICSQTSSAQKKNDMTKFEKQLFTMPATFLDFYRIV